MKLIFLSLPMSGRSDEEVLAEIEEMKKAVTVANLFDGEEVGFVHNFNYNPYEYRPVDKEDVKTEPLLYLGYAIQQMAFCDAAIFSKDTPSARGCNAELNICMSYNIPSYHLYDADDMEDEDCFGDFGIGVRHGSNAYGINTDRICDCFID